MRTLLAIFMFAATATFANDVSYRSLQSGSPTGPTPLHDHGLFGQGQIIAILDTGADFTSCYLAEPDGSRPPFNTGTPAGGLGWQNVDHSRRKIIAYNYLYSCDQYPGARGCERVGVAPFDNTRHGTFAATIAAGDRGAPLHHDFADSIATGAKLIIQDGGFIGGDLCTQRPGFGCPAVLTPILEQAWRQGARIHSNSWGDMQGRYPDVPTANYPQSARDIDAFVYSHPDMLVIFNTGNRGGGFGTTPLSSLSAPGSAKNTLQIGGTRDHGDDDDVLYARTLFGPTRDGRIKPDLVGPARVVGGDVNDDGDPATCETTRQPGTSWAAPSIAGAAALVRQYYTDGFYPSGSADAANGMHPSAALLKATLIAAARPVPKRDVETTNYLTALPVPSHEQGWGFPVLDDVLYFPGDARRLHVVDVPREQGLAAGESVTLRLAVRSGTPLRAVLVWTDPPGTVRGETDATPQLVNDLDLRIDGVETVPDRLNNVEVVNVNAPESRTYTITVAAHRLGSVERQGYALVVTGDLEDAAPPRARAVRRR